MTNNEYEVEALLNKLFKNEKLLNREEFSEKLELEGFLPLRKSLWESWYGCRYMKNQFPDATAYYKLTDDEHAGYKWAEMYILVTEHSHQHKKVRYSRSLFGDWRVVVTNINPYTKFIPNMV